jgi:hypothetical protein
MTGPSVLFKPRGHSKFGEFDPSMDDRLTRQICGPRLLRERLPRIEVCYAIRECGKRKALQS